MVGGIAQQHTGGGASGKFVGHGGGLIREAEAAEDPEMVIGWWCAEQALVRSLRAGCLTGTAIEKVCRRGQSLNLERREHASVQEQAANVRMMRSAVPFCEEVYGHDKQKTLP
jgi:hypothetical protein